MALVCRRAFAAVFRIDEAPAMDAMGSISHNKLTGANGCRRSRFGLIWESAAAAAVAQFGRSAYT
jgi:hypothetical protein